MSSRDTRRLLPCGAVGSTRSASGGLSRALSGPAWAVKIDGREGCGAWGGRVGGCLPLKPDLREQRSLAVSRAPMVLNRFRPGRNGRGGRGERALMEVKGQGGTVVWDGEFIAIVRKGFLARATIGKGEKRFPIASINAVQWKPAGPVMNGFIQFTIGGGNEARSKFGSQTQSAAKDENSVIFTKKQMPQFEALRKSIEEAIAQRGRPAAVAPPDNLAQLKQLGELRDSGIISTNEFETKKAEILGRL